MDDLISRQAAIDAISGLVFLIPDEKYGCKTVVEMEDAEDAITRLPATTGKWIPENTSGPYYCQTFVCSECGKITRITVMGEPRHRYCPHCGAKMENGTE